MKRLRSALPLSGGHEVALPAAVEELLVKVVTDGFTLYRCGSKEAPRALVACYQWAQHVDLLTVGDFARVVTARVPTRGRRVDIFAPEGVVWAYGVPRTCRAVRGGWVQYRYGCSRSGLGGRGARR